MSIYETPYQLPKSVVNGSSLLVPRIDIAGHSIPAAGGAVGGDQNAYPDRVGKALGVRTRANIAQGGAVACWPSANASGDGGWSWILSNFRPTNSGDGNGGYQPNTSIAIPHLGLNDLAELGSLTPKPFIEAMRTILSRYCAAALFPDTDASWAYTGTWTPITANWTYAGGTAHSTTTVTDRATWTTPADYPGNLICAIQLAMVPGAVSAGRSITLGISIDGGAVTNYVFSLDKGGYADAENGKTNGIVLRIGRADQGLGIALSAAQHTIAISYVSGVGSPSLIVNGAWIEADPLDGPVLVVPSSYRAVSPTNNGYNIWAAYTHGPAAGVDPMNDASVATWNTALQTLLGDFPGRSVWVDIDAVIGKQAQYLSPTDYTHPTNRGHQLIAQTIHSAIIASGLLTPRLRAAALAERFADSWDGGLWRPIGGAFGTSIGIAFLNSWVDYGNTTVWAPCGYRKDLEGRVHLRGTVKSGSAANAIMFQLPASYCPLIGLNLPSVSQGGTFANMQLGSSSVLNVVAQNGGSTTWTVLPMVPFIAGD